MQMCGREWCVWGWMDDGEDVCGMGVGWGYGGDVGGIGRGYESWGRIGIYYEK